MPVGTAPKKFGHRIHVALRKALAASRLGKLTHLIQGQSTRIRGATTTPIANTETIGVQRKDMAVPAPELNLALAIDVALRQAYAAPASSNPLDLCQVEPKTVDMTDLAPMPVPDADWPGFPEMPIGAPEPMRLVVSLIRS